MHIFLAGVMADRIVDGIVLAIHKIHFLQGLMRAIRGETPIGEERK